MWPLAASVSSTASFGRPKLLVNACELLVNACESEFYTKRKKKKKESEQHDLSKMCIIPTTGTLTSVVLVEERTARARAFQVNPISSSIVFRSSRIMLLFL
jgi:hypothetical protein